VRLTGGEPLVRSDLETLVEYVCSVPGIDDVSMTTNASLMTLERSRSLRAAGLRRLNISLDALNDATFMRVNDVGVPVSRVLEGIDNATAAGFESIKVNMVVRKGLNEQEILPMARFFHGTGCILRFIEFMDVGNSNHWDLSEVYPASRIVADIDTELPIEPVSANYRGEVAKRWRYRDGGGEIGVIASVTEPFCRDCSRARLSAIGQVYTCLFATRGHDLREPLRQGVDDDGLREHVRRIWSARGDRYSELRGRLPGNQVKVEMSYIGG
jgi:cyclic pyranopterin phosphate synthase